MELIKHKIGFFNRITINYVDQIMNGVNFGLQFQLFGLITVVVPFETDIGKEENEIHATSVSAAITTEKITKLMVFSAFRYQSSRNTYIFIL